MDTLKKLAGIKLQDPVILPSEDAIKSIKETYEKAHQGQVFTFWDQLDKQQQAALYNQLTQIDPAKINEIVKKTKSTEKADAKDLAPLPESACASTIDASQEDRERWYTSGLKLISENKVAVVVMAGGQGTRLGSSDPKGCYDIGLPSRKSLFQLQAERIIKVQKLATKQEKLEDPAVVPWYIMTSEPTRASTQAFFTKHKYFGLNSDNIKFFDQGTLPCIDNEDKILLDKKHSVSVAPDGNGGIYTALITGGILADMKSRSIEHIQVYCVDNCLAKVADPIFFGWSASKALSIATKVVRKRDPEESVGLVMLRNGKPDVVEYSEIDPKIAAEKDGDKLKFRAANIVQHYYSFAFLEDAPRWSMDMPYHVANKKISYCDLTTGEVVKPEKPNAVKMEQFVFDVFPMIDLALFGCLEVSREDEFSPLKNATGQDSPESSRRDMLAQGARWVKAAGGMSVDDGSETGNDGVEVSPLISYSGEGLSGHVKGEQIKGCAYIEINRG